MNFLSQVRLTNWNRRYKHSRLRQRVDKADWRDHSYVPIVNAFYSSSRNAMIFPAGILQGLFFNHKVHCLARSQHENISLIFHRLFNQLIIRCHGTSILVPSGPSLATKSRTDLMTAVGSTMQMVILIKLKPKSQNSYESSSNIVPL